MAVIAQGQGGPGASWGVAATVDEPAVLTAAFVAHHLMMGAAEVHIMLDRPNPETRDLLAGIPGVVVTEAGEDGWRFRNIGQAPERRLARQKYHASRVLSETSLDWIVHCDADEFVWPLAGSVGEVLGSVRQEASWARLKVAERAHLMEAPEGDIFQGVFRFPWDRFEAEGPQFYDDAAMLLLNDGICGYQHGKAAVRSGRDLFLGVYRPMRDYAGRIRDIPLATPADLRLLHFDGLTELHYILRMMRYALNASADPSPKHGPARRLQYMAMAAEASHPSHLHEQFAAAKALAPEQADALEARGLLARWQPDVAASVSQVFGRALDLSPAAFDQALLRHERPLILRAAKQFGFDPMSFVAK